MVQRLFVDLPLREGLEVEPPPAAAHYLISVLRVRVGDLVRLFDDRTGEWEAAVVATGRRSAKLRVASRIRPREQVPDLWLCAAPLKKSRIDWVAEKACELGVARLVPVITRRTVVGTPNLDRLRAHMVEAAEQCGRSALPELVPPVGLDRLLGGWPAERTLFFADEEGGPVMQPAPGPAALLIGPEGGFAPEERAAIRAHPSALSVGLGPRILRADTAAVSAIALWMAASGDWTGGASVS